MAGEPAGAATHLAEQAPAGGILAAGEGVGVPSMFLAAIHVLTLTER